MIQQRFFLGFDYQLLSGLGTVNSDVFFNDTVDGDHTFTRHRIQVLLGAQAGAVRPYLGVGFLMYDGNADLTEAEDALRLFLGVEFTQGMYGARFDLLLVPRIGVTVGLFVRI